MNSRFLVSIAVLLFAAQAWADEVKVSDARIAASAKEHGSAMVSMTITSQKDAHLVAVTSPASASAQIHIMKNENGAMIMRPVDALALPAKHEIVLGASGDHIHLIDLKRPLKAGDSVPLTLTIEFADKSKEKVAVNATVRPSAENHAAMPGMPSMPGM